MKSDKKNKARGYKKTPIGLVPIDWKIMELRDILDYEQPGKYLTNNLTDDESLPIPVLTANKSFILGYTNETVGVFNNPPVIIFDDFTTASRYIDFPFKIKSSAIKLLSAKNNHNLKFIFEKLQLIQINTQDHKRRWISEFEEKIIYLPSIAEQNEIANIFTIWDNAINNNKNIIKKITQRNNGLAQNLLLGKKRLKGYKDKWRQYKIGDLFKSEYRYVDWDETKLYELVSIRRRHGGLFYRGDLIGEDIGVKKLKIIHSEDFLISRRQVSHGAWVVVSNNFHNAKVSDEYDCLVIKNKKILSSNFWSWYCKLPSMVHYAFLDSTGVHIEKLIFNLNLFEKREIEIPSSIEEQKAITQILESADQELKIYEEKLVVLQNQKKGLMQKLLTGEIRVK